MEEMLKLVCLNEITTDDIVNGFIRYFLLASCKNSLILSDNIIFPRTLYSMYRYNF